LSLLSIEVGKRRNIEERKREVKKKKIHHTYRRMKRNIRIENDKKGERTI
jgi:hypothetical protein